MKHYKWFTLMLGIALVLALLAVMTSAQDDEPTFVEPGDSVAPEPGTEGDEALIDGMDTEFSISPQAATGSAFTYQGRLERNGQPVDDTCDMEFRLFNAETGGSQAGDTRTSVVSVRQGLFTAVLDYGRRAFSGEGRWLEIAVRCPSGSGTYTSLNPREAILGAPYALGLQPGIELVGDADAGRYSDLFKVQATGGRRAITGQSNVPGGVGVAGSARTTSGTAIGVHGRTDSADGYGGYFVNLASGGGSGAGIYASGRNGSAPDIILGTDGGSGGDEDDATIAADPGNVWSDLHLRGQDKVIVTIGDNDLDSADSRFIIFSQGREIFNALPNGTISVPVLQITGGADLSEHFDVQAYQNRIQPEAGLVVCIDAHNPGKLVVCSKAYNHTVAGVISGAGGVETGMMMGQEGTAANGQHPVALTGRVYVSADASHGPIQPGDLLTTSNTPGYAMKVKDHNLAQGAILGKAMTELEVGRGLVLVLVSLQ